MAFFPVRHAFHTINPFEVYVQQWNAKIECVNGFMSPSSLRAVVLEDREAIRYILKNILAEPLNCESEYFSCYRKIKESRDKPNIFFFSAQLVPYGELIRYKHEGVKSVVFGESFTPTSVLWWRKRGADGLIDLRDGLDSWRACITEVLQGGNAATPSAKDAILNSDPEVGLQTLTRREMEVALYLVLGRSAEQAAKTFGTSVGTIKNQRKSVYRKLGIVRATQLPWAMANGIPHVTNKGERVHNLHVEAPTGPYLSPDGD
jgi:DNA-binding CsgD family transcriptional regulator